MEFLDTLLSVSLEIKLAWIVIKLSDFFEFAINEITVQEHLHYSTTFVLCHITDNITPQQSQMLHSDQLVEQR